MDLVQINTTNLKVTLMKMQSLTDEFSDEEGVRSTSGTAPLLSEMDLCSTSTFKILSYKFQ